MIREMKSEMILAMHDSILTWFFVLKLLEQSSAHKSHVILSNFQGLEPRFEWYSLSTAWF